MKSKLKIPDIIILIALATTLLYVLVFRLPEGIRSFRFFWGPASLIIIILTYPKIFIKNPMKYLLVFVVSFIYIFPNILWTHRTGLPEPHLHELYVLVYLTAIWCYYRANYNFKGLARISKYAFIFILITLVLTNVALSMDSMVVREAAAGFSDNVELLKIYRLTGSANYGYAQAFVLLIPILVYHIKKRKQMVFQRNVLIVILAVIIITTLRAQVFANVLVAVFALLSAFIGYEKRMLVFRYMVILLIVFVVIPSSFYANILTFVGSYFDPDTELHKKLNDFSIFLESPELADNTDAGLRAQRYPLLLEAFLANPITGHIASKSSLNIDPGGHLYWMYRLALYGSIYFIFFVFVLYKIYKAIVSVFEDDEIKFYYFLSVAAFILFGLMKNIAGREPWVFLIVVIPGLYFLPLLKQKEIKKKQQSLKQLKKQNRLQK